MNSTDDGPVERLFTGCDVEGYSGLGHDRQRDIQHDLLRLHQRAASNARVSSQGVLVQERGDGHLSRWPRDINILTMVTDYVRELYLETVRLNRTRAADHQLRLRVVLTSAMSEQADYGFAGPGPIIAAYLVDSEPARRALKYFPDHPMVVLIDDPIYQNYVATGVRGLRANQYIRVRVQPRGKSFERTAWLTVPGADPARLTNFRRTVRGRSGRASGKANEEQPAGQVGTQGDGIDTPPPASGSGRRGRMTPTLIAGMSTIAAAFITAGAILMNDQPGTSGTGLTMTASSTTTTAASTDLLSPITSTLATTGSAVTGGRYPETAGNRRGVQTFADTTGRTSGRGAIPYLTTVEVVCIAPNRSDMTSINAFYLISGGTWDRTYAPANTFLNGDPPGVAGTHHVDPAVPPCP